MKQCKPNCTCGCPASYHCLDQVETNCTECDCKQYTPNAESVNVDACALLRKRIETLEEEVRQCRKPCLHCGRSNKAE